MVSALSVYGADAGAIGLPMPAATRTRPKQPTWRDLMEPGEPEPVTLTRPAFVDRLRAEGIDVAPRTLAYWESAGIIPRSSREWRDGAPQSVYPEWMLAVVRTVRGMQAQGATLAQIREAVQTTPWRAPMLAPGEPPTSRADLAARWDAYTRAAEDLAPKIVALAQLQAHATGTNVVHVEIQFRDDNGTTRTLGIDSLDAWPRDDAVDGDSAEHIPITVE